MSERTSDCFLVSDFDSISDGHRIMRAPSINNILQLNTNNKPDSHPVLQVSKLDSNIAVKRIDDVPIQVAIGGYRLLDEGLSFDDAKTIVPVFKQPVPVVEFIKLDDMWSVDPSSSEVIHPNRARRFALVVGSVALRKPILSNDNMMSLVRNL